MEQAFFVLGCARSGTTLLHQLIASHSQVVGVCETELLKKYNPGQPVKTLVREVALTPEEETIVWEYFSRSGIGSSTNPFVLLDAYCRAHARRSGRQHYVEKSPIHTYFGMELLENIPSAKLVLMMRNPRSVVASRLHSRKTSRGQRFNLPRKLQLLLNLSEVLFTYRYFDWLLETASPALRPRILIVCYENLATDTEASLRAVLEFLELPFEPVHEAISPLDLRLDHWQVAGLMNSSFEPRKSAWVSRSALMHWKNVLSNREVALVDCCFASGDCKLIRDFYDEYRSGEGRRNFYGKVLRYATELDRYWFLRRNAPYALARARSFTA